MKLEGDFHRLLNGASNERSRSGLRDLVVKHPDHALSGEALLRIGEISMDLNDPTEALLALKAAGNKGQNRPELMLQVENALVAGMLKSGALIGASRQYVAFADEDAARKSTAAAHSARAFVAMIDGDYPLASGQWTAAAEQAKTGLAKTDASVRPVKATYAAALLGQALCEELSGQSAQAVQRYQLVLHEFPASPEATVARQRVADLGRPILKTP